MTARRLITAMIVGASALTLAACSSNEIEAPTDTGICYHVTFPDNEPPKFNVLAREQPQIEFCAARLEEMRLRFLRMGGSTHDLVGAYQGQFIFIDRAGVKFGKSLEGPRFFALTRTGDGRLAIPGAIQREIDGRPVAVAPN